MKWYSYKVTHVCFGYLDGQGLPGWAAFTVHITLAYPGSTPCFLGFSQGPRSPKTAFDTTDLPKTAFNSENIENPKAGLWTWQFQEFTSAQILSCHWVV